MPLPNIFDNNITTTLIQRIDQLTDKTVPQWGKMNASQMFAHCCVAYDMALTDKYPKLGFLQRTLLTWFVKDGVVNEKPYPRNSRTAPEFIIKDTPDFIEQKAKLIAYLEQTQKLGASHFEGKESRSFGPMTSIEWSNLFYKHLDHHLTQFGV